MLGMLTLPLQAWLPRRQTDPGYNSLDFREDKLIPATILDVGDDIVEGEHDSHPSWLLVPR